MIIIGAGGLAIQITDVLERSNSGNEFVFFDNVNVYGEDPKLFSYPIIRTIGEIVELNKKGNRKIVLGISGPATRESIYRQFKLHKLNFHTLVSGTSLIGRHAVSIGEGTVILEQVCIESTVSIGNACLINTDAKLFHGTRIGDFCEIAPGALLLGNCKLGNNVFVGSGATILPGLTIGDQAVIGAGAVVTKNVPDSTLIKGFAGKMY